MSNHNEMDQICSKARTIVAGVSGRAGRASRTAAAAAAGAFCPFVQCTPSVSPERCVVMAQFTGFFAVSNAESRHVFGAVKRPDRGF